MEEQLRWTGRLFMGHGWLLYAGPLATTQLHAHHAFQVMLTVGRPFVLVMARARQRTRHTPSSSRPHPPCLGLGILRRRAPLHASTPDTLEGRSLKALGLTPAAASWAGAAEGLHRLTRAPLPRSWEEGEALAHAFLFGYWDRAAAYPWTAYSARAARAARATGDGGRQPRRAGGCRSRRPTDCHTSSPTSCVWAFATCCGCGCSVRRPSSAWGTLTEAAHAAGFSDSAHLSHTFRRMFGLAPSQLANAVEWVLPPSEDKSP